jgi:hypothetical protein
MPRELDNLNQRIHLLARTFDRLIQIAHTHNPRAADLLRKDQSLVGSLSRTIANWIAHHDDPYNTGVPMVSMHMVKSQAALLASGIQLVDVVLDAAEDSIFHPELAQVAILAAQIEADARNACSALTRAAHTAELQATKRKKKKKRSARPMRPVMPLSRALAQCAVRVLPLSEQALYRDIFTSELHELAQDRWPHHAQIAYVVRILLRSPLLRRELRAPAPPHRQRSR